MAEVEALRELETVVVGLTVSVSDSEVVAVEEPVREGVCETQPEGEEDSDTASEGEVRGEAVVLPLTLGDAESVARVADAVGEAGREARAEAEREGSAGEAEGSAGDAEPGPALGERASLAEAIGVRDGESGAEAEGVPLPGVRVALRPLSVPEALREASRLPVTVGEPLANIDGVTLIDAPGLCVVHGEADAVPPPARALPSDGELLADCVDVTLTVASRVGDSETVTVGDVLRLRVAHADVELLAEGQRDTEALRVGLPGVGQLVELALGDDEMLAVPPTEALFDSVVECEPVREKLEVPVAERPPERLREGEADVDAQLEAEAVPLMLALPGPVMVPEALCDGLDEGERDKMLEPEAGEPLALGDSVEEALTEAEREVLRVSVGEALIDALRDWVSDTVWQPLGVVEGVSDTDTVDETEDRRDAVAPARLGVLVFDHDSLGETDRVGRSDRLARADTL